MRKTASGSVAFSSSKQRCGPTTSCSIEPIAPSAMRIESFSRSLKSKIFNYRLALLTDPDSAWDDKSCPYPDGIQTIGPDGSCNCALNRFLSIFQIPVLSCQWVQHRWDSPILWASSSLATRQLLS